MAHHPPHPQFLDVDWPQTHHEAAPSQPLQLETEYDIDPTRYSIFQGDLQPQPPPQMDRRRSPPTTGYSMEYGRPFGGQNEYAFTFPNPLQQQQHQQQQQPSFGEQHAYDAGQFYSDHQGSNYSQARQGQQFHSSGMPYGDGSNQSIPSSPYYTDTGDSSPFPFSPQNLPGQGHGMAGGQHGRSSSASGITPTVRSFQGDAQMHPRAILSNAGTPLTPNFPLGSLGQGYGMPVQPGTPYREQAHMQLGDASAALHAAKRQRALDEAEADGSSVEGDDPSENGVHSKEDAKPAKP